MSRAALVLLLAVLAGPALSLSCAPYGPTDAYLAADAAETPHVIVIGTLEFSERLLPKVDLKHQDRTPQHTLIPARLSGRLLGSAGFRQPFVQDITLEVLCYGPWCPVTRSGQIYLTFLQRTDEGYLLSTNPCGGFAFGTPSPRVLREVRTCFDGGNCPPSSR